MPLSPPTPPMKPRLLDLFCGAGGAAVGYYNAGFDVVGVDNRSQPRYPFEFIQADALRYLLTPRNVHAIHASPPCQFFSVATPDNSRYTEHIDLITPIRPLLEATGLPYVIENVEGARKAMCDPVMICGSSLGLKVRRHRLFETNWPLMVPPCAHGQQGVPVGVYGEGSSKSQKRGKKADNEAEVLDVMGMPWADRKTATQAIPPAYTELIGHQLMQHIQAKAVA